MEPPLGYSCRACGFSLWVPVAHLEVSSVGFYDDERFPGRCLVALRDHHEHLAHLPPDITNAFIADVQAVGRALETALQPVRVNYAVLGNVEPHVHAHVIPRSDDEPKPHRTPWEHPRPPARLAEGRAEALATLLREALTARS